MLRRHVRSTCAALAGDASPPGCLGRVEGGVNHGRLCRALHPPYRPFDRRIFTLRDQDSGFSRVTKRRRFDDDDPTFHKRTNRETVDTPEYETWEIEKIDDADRWST